MIKFKCEFCDQRLGVPDDFVGKRVRCTKCRAVNIVPDAKERAAREAEPPPPPPKTMPSEAPGGVLKTPSHSSLLDLSTGSGTLNIELPSDPDLTESHIFGSKTTIPAFDAQSKTAAAAAAKPAAPTTPPTKGGTAFGAQLEEEESPKTEEKNGGKKPSAPTKEDEFGLGLLENDPTDSGPGNVDLDGLGF